MGSETVEQASQAFLALMSGGGGDWNTLVPALEDAEPSVVVAAAAAVLIAEAEACTAKAQKLMGRFASMLAGDRPTMQQEDERSRSFRHAFLLAFAYRIGERMREATATATAAATAATAASGGSFLPVLAARAEAAVAVRDEAVPHLGRPMHVSMSNHWGASAGRRAANRRLVR